MNRRSILSSLCTGALALLAPVVAFAKPYRKARLQNYGSKPLVLTSGPLWSRVRAEYDASIPAVKWPADWTPVEVGDLKRAWEEAQKRETAARTCLGCGNYSWALPAGSASWDDWACRDCGTRNGSCAPLRALLAEAKTALMRSTCQPEPAEDYEAWKEASINHTVLIARIDAALKEKS